MAGPDGDVMRARAWRLATADITADWKQASRRPARRRGRPRVLRNRGARGLAHRDGDRLRRGKFLEPAPPPPGCARAWHSSRRGVHPAPARDGGRRRRQRRERAADWSGFSSQHRPQRALLRPPAGVGVPRPVTPWTARHDDPPSGRARDASAGAQTRWCGRGRRLPHVAFTSRTRTRSTRTSASCSSSSPRTKSCPPSSRRRTRSSSTSTATRSRRSP